MINLKQKYITSSFFILSIFSLILYFIIPYFLKQETFKKLNLELSSKIGTTENYLNSTMALLKKLASNNQTLDLFIENKPTNLSPSNITQQPEVNNQMLESKENKEPNSEYKKYLETSFTEFSNNHDIFIIKRNGEILFTPQKESILLKKNITKPTLKNHWLHAFFQQALFSQITDAFIKNIAKDHFFLFFTPIISQEKIIGFLFAKLSPKKLFSLLIQNSFLQKSELLLAQYSSELINIPITNKQKKEAAKIAFYDFLLTKATDGDKNQTIILENNSQPMLTSWIYYPSLDLGFLIKVPGNFIDYCAYFLMLLFIIFLLLGLYSFHKNLYTLSLENFKKSCSFFYPIIQQYSVYMCLGLLLSGLFISIAHYKHVQTMIENKALVKSEIHARSLSQKLTTIFSSLKQCANFIELKLQKKSLSENELKTIIEPLFTENKNIYSITIAFEPHVFYPSKKLFAPSWTRSSTGIDKFYIENSYDYLSSEKGLWYKNALEKKKIIWGLPSLDQVTYKKTLNLFLPFYETQDSENKKPMGVIRIAYKYSQFNDFIDSLSYRTRSRYLITNKKGKFIYHPQSENTGSNKTIFTLTNNWRNTTSKAIEQYFKKRIPQFTWAIEEHIQGTPWTLTCAFDKKDISFTKESLIYGLFIIVCSIFTLVCILLIFLKNYSQIKTTNELFLKSSNGYVGIFFIGIGALWSIYYYQPWIQIESNQVFRDQGGLYQILESLKQKTTPPNSLIPIKTGLTIKTIDTSMPSLTRLTASAWQIYDKKLLQSITPGITIANTQKIIVSKTFEYEKKDHVIVGWNIYAEILQQPDFSHYPFNKKNLIISINHTDQKNNIISIPDFKGYKISPENIFPWLNTQIDYLQDSFFSYPNIEESITDLQSQRNLNLHLIIQENILNSLVSEIIPLIIGLFSIFALLWLDPATRVAGFSGLFFAFIFLHRGLRSSLNLTSITYLEYFFITTYISLLVVTAMASFAAAKNLPDETSKYYFWPMQATAWLILAIALFFY